jgi:hypothetical protein
MFGESDEYVFQNTYLMMLAGNVVDCCKAFNQMYPSSDGGVNCHYVISDSTGMRYVEEHYAGQKPASIAQVTPKGIKLLSGFEEFAIFVPNKNAVVGIKEGNGDDANEDCEGYVYYDVFDYTGVAVDGGSLMLSQSVRENYPTLFDAIPDVLEMAFGDRDLRWELQNITSTGWENDEKWFEVPVEWKMTGIVKVFASSMEEAIAVVDRGECEGNIPEQMKFEDGSMKAI